MPDTARHSPPKQQQRPWALWLFSLAIALMPLGFSVSSQVKLLPFAILFIGGGWLLRSPSIRTEYGKARPVVLAVAFVVSMALLNVAWHGTGTAKPGLYPQTLVFLLTAVPFLLPVNRRLVWLGFGVCALALGIAAVVQCHVLGEDRAHGLNGGSWAAIEYGMFTLVMCLLCIHRLLQASIPLPERSFHGICATIAFYGVVLSESRGPLLVFPVALTLLVVLHARRRRRWQIPLGVLALGLLLTASATIARPHIIDRLDDAQEELTTLEASSHGAVRERVEMWRIAWRAFAEHPLIGVGLEGFGSYSRQQIALGRSTPSIIQYNNPHNEYLEAAATGGLPGLIALLAVFAVPLMFFARRLDSSEDAEQFYACVGGICVVWVYAQCALSNNVFYRAMPHSLYYFLVTGMAMWSITSSKDVQCRE